MKYEFLQEEDMHDTIVLFLHAQERDHHAHQINKDRFERILQGENISPAFRKRIEQLLAETNSRLEEVEAIMEASREQLPPPALKAASIQRLKDKGQI